MSPTLNELCKYMFSCAEKLEEEIKININDCLNSVTDQKDPDYQVLALEKVKDNHYKEILKLLSDIVTNIRKIIYHEEYIKKVDYRKSNSIDDVRKCHYSSIQNLNTNYHITPLSTSVQNLPSQIEKDFKRERRRVVSAVSLHSLEAWESYLKNKELEEENLPEEVQTLTVSRRKISKRKQMKFVSSTFNGFLDTGLSDGSSVEDSRLADSTELSIKEESEDESVTDDHYFLTDKSDTAQEEEYSATSDQEANAEKHVDEENMETQSDISDLRSPDDFGSNEPSEEFKPKIVDVLFKKK
nr:uncharacterized protein LOC111516363 [Leptinotarsa decemlineata]